MNYRTGPLWSLALLFLLALAPTSASAQALLVRVTDTNKQPVAGATVSVYFGTSVLGRAPSDEQGRARLAGLAAGTYDVRVEALGYSLKLVSGVRLTAGQVQAIEVELETAPIAVEGLTVNAGRVQIQRENTEFSTEVSEEAIKLLPVTHEATDLIALTPGARPGNVWGGANFQANSYRIDGVSANHPGMGGDLLQPNVNWIDKLEVKGLGAGAEFGGFQGGLIDVVTKSGSNDFQGSIRSSFENSALSSTNLSTTEIGREVDNRVDLEAEARGPIARDRLFYYVSGKRTDLANRALNHLKQVDGHYSPFDEQRNETKLFGKLTWTPGARHKLEVSGAYTDIVADNYELTGYEAAGSTHKYTSPTRLFNASLTEVLGDWGTFDARVNHFSRDERWDAYQGTDVPGVRTFALQPPYTSFENAPFTLRSAPSSTSANAMANIRIPTGTLEHTIKVGGEYTTGSFLNLRERNGGMTWFPANTGHFVADDPSTWTNVGSNWVAAQWGGEVHLDADVSNAAAFAQSSLELGHRVVITPGIRWNQWKGWLTPREGDRFSTVDATGWDPRVGLTVDLTSDRTFVAKAHWGRYHQALITQMFDRVAGADVFTNEEYWFYTHADRLTDPATSFTQAQRDAGVATNDWRKNGEEFLNETGPMQDYRQPYIDQWLVGLEKQVAGFMKFEALYTRRSNKDMIALVDLNRRSNYTVFKDVRVFDSSGSPLPFSGGSAVLDELWVPNYTLVERIRCLARADCPGALPVPGKTVADTLFMTWNPQYVLTTAPDAKREFSQFQLTLDISQPLWGATLSWVETRLEGNLDNVSGYADPDEYGPGQYVRVNEGVNSYGVLENFADREVKLSLYGILPWDIQGGLFWTYQSGDHYSPTFDLYGLGFFKYKVNTGALLKGGQAEKPGQEVDYMMLWPLEGHRVYVGPRGLPELPERFNLDVRAERTFEFQDRRMSVSLDIFNLMRSKAITQLNTIVNNGPDYGFRNTQSLFSPGIAPNQYYKAVQERVRPRSVRLGMTFFF